MARKNPRKLVIVPSHEKNQKYETLVYAGSDLFLLPSHHEPCGINQLIAMKYGCVPIVRKVGGLYDTVTNYNPTTGKGTGFTFSKFNKMSFFATIVRALENFLYKEKWEKLAVRVMQQSSGWELPAKKYIKLYKKAIKANNNK
jgi:starch synthase